MSDSERIHAFLRRARSRALLESGMRVSAHALSALLVVLLGLALVAVLVGPAASWPYVALTVIALFAAGGATLGFVRPSRAFAEPSALARLVGQRHPPLASDLLSAVELAAARTGDAPASSDMTHAFYAQVAEAAAPLGVEQLFPLRRAVRALLIAAVLLFAGLVGVLVSPSVLGLGLRTLFRTPSLFEGARVAREPLVGDVRVTYEFPAYTGLPRQVIEGSTGELRAVRGTRVELEMRPLRTARRARLLLGESGQTGTHEAVIDHGTLRTELALSESGAYRVWLEPFLGRPLREEHAHRIVVENDEPPEVDISGPADRLELLAPRPVEVAYHARDDFGLADVALVYRINNGPEQRILLKNAQGARELRATTMFEPVSALLVPGAQVAYRIEARDRDEVSGSKTGVSRTLRMVISSPRGPLEEHLAREHDLLEGLLASLGDRIDIEHGGKAAAPAGLARLREVHEAERAHATELERLVEQQRRGGPVPKVQAAPLAAIATRLARLLRDEQAQLAGGASKSGAAAAALLTRLLGVLPRHVAELESAVLALDDLIGRQRLGELAAIGKDLVAAHKRLQDLLARYRATGDEQLRRQIEREVRELRARIAELTRKIAEVKARNEVTLEWMNLPDARKALALAERLDSLLAKGDARSLGDALAELGDSLASLQDLLERNAGDFGNARFPEESRALAELKRKLSDLEGDQRAVADDSQALAKEVDGELTRRLEAQQGEFLAKAKQKLDQIARKLRGGAPRELGDAAETATHGARASAQQLRRLLLAKEWGLAQGEAERLADGLGHLQRIVERQRSLRRPGTGAAASFAEQVDESETLARELASELGQRMPRPGESGSPEQRGRGRELGQRQLAIEDKTRGLARELGRHDEATPAAGPAAMQLEEIAGQMRQAGQDLQGGAAREGATRADEAAQRLAQLRRSVGQQPNQGSYPSREPVRIPDADAYQAPREWRHELMEAMREKPPERYREEVRHYYEELVR